MVSAISDVVTLFRKFYYQASYIVKKYYTIINGTPGMYIFLFCGCLENLFVKKFFFSYGPLFQSSPMQHFWKYFLSSANQSINERCY